ncbi:hypothetical protein GW17_00061381 [Ensete ventricosum]|nr:hypothetical protein GW17_00061381 [Ensete ventricosum]
MLGQSQVRASGQGSDDVVGTRRETCRKLAEGIKSLPGVHRELTEGIGGLPGVCRKLAEGIESFLGDRWELAKMASRVYRKKTKRLAGRSSGVIESLPGDAVEEEEEMNEEPV